MYKRINIKHILNFRIISYIYILLLTVDDTPLRFYFALPWILYLLFDSYKIEFSTKKRLWQYGLIVVFLLSLFYNKSESSIYHPMVEDEIILQKNLYVSKDFRHGKFYASANDFHLNDEKWILIPKGEKIKIISFIRREVLSLEPKYDIEIDTALKPQILEYFNQNENSKLYFWSNNFFYEIGMLSNELVQEYTITSNRLFRVLYLFYPFTLLYLLLQSFKNSMNKIQIKYNFHPINFILYTIAYYYVLMASINDGITGFSLGIPYALFLVWEVFSLKKGNKTKYLHIFILILAIFLSFSDRSKLEILYPMVGESYTISSDINYSYGSFYINKIEIYNDKYYDSLDEQKEMFRLKAGDSFHIKSQRVSGHADFGINYTYEIESKNFSDLSDYIEKNLVNIKLLLNNEQKRHSKKEKIDFYFGEEKKFYISDYELRELMKVQGLNYNESNFENGAIYMGFHPFIYLFILMLFFLILIFRERNI